MLFLLDVSSKDPHGILLGMFLLIVLLYGFMLVAVPIALIISFVGIRFWKKGRKKAARVSFGISLTIFLIWSMIFWSEEIDKFWSLLFG